MILYCHILLLKVLRAWSVDEVDDASRGTSVSGSADSGFVPDGQFLDRHKHMSHPLRLSASTATTTPAISPNSRVTSKFWSKMQRQVYTKVNQINIDRMKIKLTLPDVPYYI